jgi:hypothetical protein
MACIGRRAWKESQHPAVGLAMTAEANLCMAGDAMTVRACDGLLFHDFL